jgi:uncharacterized membrane protein
MQLLTIATILCIGMLLGTEFTVSAFINPVLKRLDRASQAVSIQMFAARLGKAMPFWYGASLLLLIANTVLLRHQGGVALLFVSSVLWILVIAVTLLVLVPINNRMIQMDATSFGDEAQKAHDRWEALHRLRVLALVVSFVCYLVALQIGNPIELRRPSPLAIVCLENPGTDGR